jgi:aminoglycoside 3'-phosphotransferase-2
MNLPLIMRNDLQNYTLSNKKVSRLGGINFQFKSNMGSILYLKTGVGIAAESLIRENTALQWLGHRQITVPKVLNYLKEENSGKVYLLLSAIEGLPAHRVSNLDKREILRIAAEGLKHFHSLDIKGSENLRTLDQDLAQIQTCISRDLIKKKEFQLANNGKTPGEIYTYLYQKKNAFSADVIVHGDYCLPNIIIAKNNIGFIDVGDSGPGDPYKDFSAMEVSIARNFGTEWINIFYKYYDTTIKINKLKIKYYQLIDQFGYHLDVEKFRKEIVQSSSSILLSKVSV